MIKEIMSNRKDISDKLVHFTKGDNNEEAFQRLLRIMKERRIVGTREKIKGEYKCVCFTEAPLMSLKDGLVNPDAYSRYSPFGVLFDKRWIFVKGGRPVIYQADEEFDLLPESHKWRHVRYEPNRDEPIDFAWEREWRIQCEFLQLDPSVAVIVVPSGDWAERMKIEHELEQDNEVFEYSQIFDEIIAEQFREDFEWRIYALK